MPKTPDALRRISPLALVFILFISAISQCFAATNEGYGEDETNLGQFVDSFENINNISVLSGLERNAITNSIDTSLGDFLKGWDHRRNHTINGTVVGVRSNYQVGIKIYYGAGADGTETVDGDVLGKIYLDSKSQTDFDDIRFTTSDGLTLLDHWLEIKSDSNYAIFWVEIDTIPASPNNVLIYIYYGNVGASSASNGDNTFPFFDDFSSLNLTKWDIQKKGSAAAIVSVAGGELSLAGQNGVSSSGGVSTKTFTTTNSFKTKARKKASANYYRLLSFGNGSITGYGGVSWWYTTFDFGYSQFMGGAAALAQLDRWDSGVPTNLVGSGAVSAGNNAYYIEAHSYDQSGVWTLFTTGGSRGPTTDTTYQNNSKKVLLAQGEHGPTSNGGTSTFDWFFIRNYVSAEPIHTSFGAEETAPDQGYMITSDYLDYVNGSVLVQLFNSSIPSGSKLTVQFSDNNSTWVNSRGIAGNDTLEEGFMSIDLRDLNWSISYYMMINFSGLPKLYQSRLISTLGPAGAASIQNVTGEWIYYNLTAIANITGVHDEGFVNSTYFIDGDTWNCSEVVGAPGYIVNFNVTEIDTDAISLWLLNYVYYDGVVNHHIHVEAWNFTAPGWVEIGLIDDDVRFEWHNYTVYEMRVPNDFVNSTGAFVGRFNHVTAGNINDDIVFDRISLLAFVPSAAAGVVEPFQFFWIVIAIALMLIGIVLAKMWPEEGDP